MTNGIPAIRLVLEPSTWATPPERMSFSKLRQIESCPRRWSLMASEYQQIWSKRGYPEPLITANIIGRVTHRAIEFIVKECHRKGCGSFDDPQTIAVMRDMGGFSCVIEKCAEETLFQFTGNPRANGRLGDMKKHLNEKKGEIRENVRILLSRMLASRYVIRRDPSGGYGEDGPLGYGVHPEVRLVNEEMRWEGIADVITLSPDECEIRDIKTGMPKEEHSEQLRIYSLLWILDTRKNPAGRSATRLTVSYIQGDVDVPLLSTSGIAAFLKELEARTNASKERLTKNPPEAIPSPDGCRHCTVRHLCSKYWETETQNVLSESGSGGSMLDIEIQVVGIHGSRSYDVISVVSSVLPENTPLVYRFSGSGEGLKKGDRIRLLGVTMVKEEDDEAAEHMVISSSKITESYQCNVWPKTP